MSRQGLTAGLLNSLIAGSGQVAQSVEQGTENPRVGSSILSLATRFQGPCGDARAFFVSEKRANLRVSTCEEVLIMALATLGSKGQVTIPKTVRDSLGIQAGDRVEFVEIAPGRFEILAVNRDVRELKGIVGKAERVVSVEEMNEAIAKMGR